MIHFLFITMNALYVSALLKQDYAPVTFSSGISFTCELKMSLLIIRGISSSSSV